MALEIMMARFLPSQTDSKKKGAPTDPAGNANILSSLIPSRPKIPIFKSTNNYLFRL
jgi:hypothetical protein